MKVQQNEGFTTLVFSVKELAEHHWKNEKLYRVERRFEWATELENAVQLATVSEVFGETEMDFAEEYLLLHGSDEVSWYWEP